MIVSYVFECRNVKGVEIYIRYPVCLSLRKYKTAINCACSYEETSKLRVKKKKKKRKKVKTVGSNTVLPNDRVKKKATPILVLGQPEIRLHS